MNKENLEFDEEKFKKTDISGYAENFSENSFSDKVKSNVKSAGIVLLYKALQLYYVTKNPNCPKRIKAGIFAALGYFIAPIDFLPDLIPIAGYTDDATAVALAVTMAQFYIDEKVKQDAKNRLKSIFGEKAVAKLD